MGTRGRSAPTAPPPTKWGYAGGRARSTAKCSPGARNIRPAARPAELDRRRKSISDPHFLTRAPARPPGWSRFMPLRARGGSMITRFCLASPPPLPLSPRPEFWRASQLRLRFRGKIAGTRFRRAPPLLRAPQSGAGRQAGGRTEAVAQAGVSASGRAPCRANWESQSH